MARYPGGHTGQASSCEVTVVSRDEPKWRTHLTWVNAVVIIAVLQVAFSLTTPWLTRGAVADPRPIPDFVFVALVVVFAGVAGLLFIGGRGDHRARQLAIGYLLSASAFSGPLLDGVADIATAGSGLAHAVIGIRPDVFLPYFAWQFFAEFPRITRFGRAARVQRIASAVSLWGACVLLIANLVEPVFSGSEGSPIPRILSTLSHRQSDSLYWPFLLALLLGSFVFALWKARSARTDERRRVRWMTLGIAVGVSPVLLENALSLMVPAFSRFVDTPDGLRLVGIMAYPLIAAGPLITAYAVLVHRALDVSLVIRKAIRYAMLRYGMLGVVAVPFAVFAFFLYASRTKTLAEIFSGQGILILVAATVVGIAAFRLQGRVFDSIDRVFFRDHYDSRRVLRDLVERSREAVGVNELGELLTGELDRALHLESLGLSYLDPSRGALVSAHQDVRPIETESELVGRLTAERRPVEVDWERGSGVWHRLPQSDQDWLTDSGFRLLVPLVDSNDGLIGILGLGDKRSELPFSEEDKDLLAAIAASAALGLENRMLRTSADSLPPAGTAARECAACGGVRPGHVEHCEACGGSLRSASVPFVLAGKYEVRERIGRGGMGVVYRGVDLTLERGVAIKTLPRVSPSHSQRLRREARAMAALAHPNLAMIYAVEFWMGTPLLIVEYLGGGTLKDRIADGPMPIPSAVGLATALADVTACVHKSGFLHRDIKPSNVGFSNEGTAKLLDFGLARMTQVGSERGDAAATAPNLKELAAAVDGMPADPLDTFTAPGAVIGTLPYMSPEAIEGKTPNPTFDVWSISIVLYEMLAGRLPSASGSPLGAIAQIAGGGFPDVREFRPDAPGGLAELLGECLASELDRRPSSAGELHRRLETLYVPRVA